MAKNKTIILFTGGGVAPALNASLFGAIRRARKYRFRVLGGLYGWKSLLFGGKILDLKNINIESLKNNGGTFLKTSRTNPFKEKGGIFEIKNQLKNHKIDYIVAIGGDDTLGAATRVWEENKIPIVGIPKTIDNDLSTTYFTPGFPTAAQNLALFCDAVRQTAYATSKIYIIETMGGKAGWLCAAASLSHADIILPPEKKVKIKNLIPLIKNYYRKNKFVVIALAHQTKFDKLKGFKLSADEYGIERTFFVSLDLKKEIEKNLRVEVKIAIPGNFLSGSDPIKIDRDYAVKLGEKAVDLIVKKKFGYMSCVKKLPSQKIGVSEILLKKACGKYRELEASFFDFKNYKVRKKYLTYVKSILGKYDFEDKKYSRLISQIK